MLPELIRMACTMFGAWGGASADGAGLVQLRALDFGSGPFANFTVLSVARALDGGKGGASGTSGVAVPAFASLSFPGFVGAITGVSTSLALSEKVRESFLVSNARGTFVKVHEARENICEGARSS